MHIAKIIVSGFPRLHDNTILDFTMKTATKKSDHDFELKQVSMYEYIPICHLFFGGKEEGKESIIFLIRFCYRILLTGMILPLPSFSSNEICLEIYFYEAERIYFYQCRIGKEDDCPVFLSQALFCKTAYSKREAHHLKGRYKRMHSPNLNFAKMGIIPLLLPMKQDILFCENHLSKLQLIQRIFRLYPQMDISMQSKLLHLFSLPFTSMFYDGNGHFLLSYAHDEAIFNIHDFMDCFSFENLQCLYFLISAYLAIEKGAILILSSLDYVPPHIAEHIVQLFLDRRLNRHGSMLFCFSYHFSFADMFHREDMIYLLMEEKDKYEVCCYATYYERTRTLKSKVLEKEMKLRAFDLKCLNELRTLLLQKIRS